jgi:predicted ATPase
LFPLTLVVSTSLRSVPVKHHEERAQVAHRSAPAKLEPAACYADDRVRDGAAFGTLLRRCRLAAGLTHETLAERAALSARAISDLERGVTRAPRSDTLALLVNALPLSDEERSALAAAARTQPSAPSISEPRHNLPGALTSFIGRKRELEVAHSLLRRPDVRLLTMTGPAGAGKTRLAVHVAMGALDAFADGTRFVALGAVTDIEQIGPAIAGALGCAGVDRPGGVGSLVELLGGQSLLLVVDNFEHLLRGAPMLIDMLRACPGLKLLVTSRAALRVSGEQVFPIPPLPVPDLNDLPPFDELVRNPAVALFEDRATHVQTDFALTSQNAASVAAICAQLDGLPLALELAAARIRLLPPAILLARLRSGTSGASLGLLSRGPRDLPDRQQTLRGAIAWSYALLAHTEQQLFRGLGVFSGGFTMDAVETVCRGGGDVVDGLTALVDNSLLQRTRGPEDEPRFMLLETIRSFALEQLSAAGDEDLLRRRHAEYYLALLEATGALLFAGAAKRQRYAAEQGNIQGALRWLVLHG